MGIESLRYTSSGCCAGCSDCQRDFGCDCESDLDEYMDASDGCCDEPWFGSAACDDCGSTLPGYRYAAHGIGSGGEIEHIELCHDCFLKLNGIEEY